MPRSKHFTLADAAHSEESMATPWFRDLVNGDGSAHNLSPGVRAVLAFVTEDVAAEPGRLILQETHQRAEEQSRVEEQKLREKEFARERMLGKLNHLMSGDHPRESLSAAALADAAQPRWARFEGVFRDEFVALTEWLWATDRSADLESYLEVARNLTQPPHPDRLIAEFIVAFSRKPMVRFRNKRVEITQLLCLAEEAAAEAQLTSGERGSKGDLLERLLESGSLKALSKMDGQVELDAIDRQWRTHCEEWRLIRWLPEGIQAVRWGRAMLLAAAIHVGTRARLSNDSHEAADAYAGKSVPRALLNRAGESAAVDVAIIEAVRLDRERIRLRLEDSLHHAELLSRSSSLASLRDLGQCLSSDWDAAQIYLATNNHVEWIKDFLTDYGAAEEVVEALHRLAPAVQLAARQRPTNRGEQDRRAVADRWLAILVRTLCPNEPLSYFGRRVDRESIADFSFGTVDWQTVQGRIEGFHHVSGIVDHNVLRLHASGALSYLAGCHGHTDLRPIVAAWMEGISEFKRVLEQVEHTTGTSIIGSGLSRAQKASMYGILLTVAADQSLRERLAAAANRTASTFRRSHRSWFQGQGATGIGRELALCLLGELAKRQAEYPGGLEEHYRRKNEKRWNIGEATLASLGYGFLFSPLAAFSGYLVGSGSYSPGLAWFVQLAFMAIVFGSFARSR